jgi:hypothetical protein
MDSDSSEPRPTLLALKDSTVLQASDYRFEADQHCMTPRAEEKQVPLAMLAIASRGEMVFASCQAGRIIPPQPRRGSEAGGTGPKAAWEPRLVLPPTKESPRPPSAA